jgi:hypothetical protein
MKNAVFWDVTPCGSCKIRRLGGTYHVHHQDDKNRGTRNFICNKQPKNAAKKYAVLSSQILVTLLIEAKLPSDTPVLTIATPRSIPQEELFIYLLLPLMVQLAIICA